MENANFVTWTSVRSGSQMRSRSRPFQGQIVSVLNFYQQVGGGPSTERHSSSLVFRKKDLTW